MLMVQCSLDVIDCRIWHAAPLENLQPFLCRLLLCFVLNESVNVGAVLHTVAVCDKARIGLPLGEPKSIA